jgi:hypothetical protein
MAFFPWVCAKQKSAYGFSTTYPSKQVLQKAPPPPPKKINPLKPITVQGIFLYIIYLYIVSSTFLIASSICFCI